MDYKKSSTSFYLLVLILLMNPMLWIMSNRYMPDFMGLSIFIASFYLLTSEQTRDKYIGGFLFGILLGVRLSYFPLLILPILLLLYNSRLKVNIVLLSMFLAGCFVWLLPMVWITGFDNIIYLAQNQTLGHFTDFGGTILTENSWINRLKYFIHTIWSDGLGGYWYGRSYYTLLLSILIIFLFYLSGKSLSQNLSNNKRFKILILSITIYALWAICFQNIIYKSRHVMPIVYLLILFISFGFKYSDKKGYIYFKVLIVAFFISLGFISTNLAIQHKGLTAIAKTREYFEDFKNPIIVSNSLVNYYLNSTGVKAEYIDVEMLKEYEIDSSYETNKNIFMIGEYQELLGNKISTIPDTVFYHNPYVNRMWSTISIYRIRL